MTRGLVNQRRQATEPATNGKGKVVAAPCYDMQAEMGVLGSIVLIATSCEQANRDLHGLIDDVFNTLRSEDFYDEAHARLFKHLRSLHANRKIDPALLVAELKSSGDYEAVGGSGYISKIITAVPNAAHAGYYRDEILKHATVRRVHQIASEILGSGSTIDLDHVDDVLRGYLASRSKPSDRDFRLLTCDDVAEWPDEEYLAEGLIVNGQPGVIGAPYKTMKTSVCTDICISLPTGGMCLGFFRVRRPVKTLFMSAESGLSTLKRTAASVCQAAGLEWPHRLSTGEIVGDELLRANLQWCTSLPQMGVDEDLLRLDRAYAKFSFEVLVIDPLFKAISGDGAENLMIQGEKFLHLQRWCEDHGVTLIIVHHLTKPASRQYEPAKLGDLSYAGIAEHVRWWLLMSRREEYLPPDPIHKLWFSAGGSAGHSGLWSLDIDLGEFQEGQPRLWTVTLTEGAEERRKSQEKRQADRASAKASAAQQRAQSSREALLATLREFPAGETKTVLKTRSGLNTAAIDLAIADAFAANEIEHCKVQKPDRRSPRDGYKLTQLAPSGPAGPIGSKQSGNASPDGQDRPDRIGPYKGPSGCPDGPCRTRGRASGR